MYDLVCALVSKIE